MPGDSESVMVDLAHAMSEGHTSGDFSRAVELIRANHQYAEALNNGEFLRDAIFSRQGSVLMAMCEVPGIDFLKTPGDGRSSPYELLRAATGWRYGNALFHEMIENNLRGDELTRALAGIPPRDYELVHSEIWRAINDGKDSGDFSQAVDLIRAAHAYVDVLNDSGFLHQAIQLRQGPVLMALCEVPGIDFLRLRERQNGTPEFQLMNSGWRYGIALVHEMRENNLRGDELTRALAEIPSDEIQILTNTDDRREEDTVVLLDDIEPQNNFASDNENDIPAAREDFTLANYNTLFSLALMANDFTPYVEFIRAHADRPDILNMQNGRFFRDSVLYRIVPAIAALVEIPEVNLQLRTPNYNPLEILQNYAWNPSDSDALMVVARTIAVANARANNLPDPVPPDAYTQLVARITRGTVEAPPRGLLNNDDDNNQSAPQNQSTTPPAEPVVTERVRPSEFLQAASTGNLETVERYLSEMRNMKQAVNIREPGTGNTALMLAAASGRMTIVDRLLKADADFMLTNRVGHTAAYLAEQGQYDDVAVRLGELMEDLEKQRKEAVNSTQAFEVETPSASTNSTSTTPQKFTDRIAAINQEDAVPEYFKCPFTREILNNPIAIKGELFDKDYLNSWFSQQSNDVTLRSTKGQTITKADINTPICIPIKDAIEAYVKAQEAIHTPKSSATTMKEQFEKIKTQAHAANDEQPQPKGPGN